jgi:hypothetical protein
MARVWKPALAFLLMLILGSLLLGLLDLDAVQGAVAALVLAVGAAAIVAGIQLKQ